MYKHAVHLVLSFALLIGASILFHFARNDGAIRQIDSVQLTSWSKPTVNADAAKAVIDTASFLNDADPLRCRNMSAVWGFPTVVWNSSTTPNCTINFVVSNSVANAGGITVSVGAPQPTNCTPGAYSIALSGGTVTNPATLVKSLSLTVTGAANTLQSVVIGSAGEFLGVWDAMGPGYQACSVLRNTTAAWVNTNLSCATEASQYCTCVYAFTQRMGNATAKIGPASGMAAMVKEGLDICYRWRRLHDIRSPYLDPIPVIQTLLAFTLALFLNSLTNLIRGMLLVRGEGNSGTLTGMAIAGMALLYWGPLVFATHFACSSGGGSALVYTAFLAWVPAMCIGIYYDFMTHNIASRPYLQPGTFSVCLCSLVTFSLLVRGVNQSELISYEIFKCQVVSLLYMTAIWFNAEQQSGPSSATGEDRNAAMYFQDAHLIILAVALASPLDTFFIPYATRGAHASSQLVEFMPFLFTLLSFAGPGLLRLLNLTHTLIAQKKTAVHDYYQDINAYCIFFVGLIFFYHFLVRHMQLYNARQGNYGFPFLSTFAGPKTVPSMYAIPGYLRTYAWL